MKTTLIVTPGKSRVNQKTEEKDTEHNERKEKSARTLQPYIAPTPWNSPATFEINASNSINKGNNPPHVRHNPPNPLKIFVNTPPAPPASPTLHGKLKRAVSDDLVQQTEEKYDVNPGMSLPTRENGGDKAQK